MTGTLQANALRLFFYDLHAWLAEASFITRYIAIPCVSAWTVYRRCFQRLLFASVISYYFLNDQ